MKRDIQLGLVGGGRWGRIYAKSVAQMDGVHLAALSSRSQNNRDIAPSNCRTTPDWWDMIGMATAKSVLDGLIIAVPPAAQVEIAAAAIEAGVPVLLEKPLALDLKSAERLLELAKLLKSFVMVDHTQLFNPAFRHMKKRLAELGGAAAINTITARAGNWGPFRHDVSVLWDWGAHEIAMTLDILGTMPSSVAVSVLERCSKGGGVGERVEIRLQFEMAAVRIYLDNINLKKFRLFEIHCGNAALRYDGVGDENFASKPPGGDAWESTRIEGPRPVDNVIKEFADGIRSGSSLHDGLRLGVDVVAVLEMCQPAIDSGYPVSIY